DEIHIRREGAALRLKLPQRPDTLRDHVVSDGKTMSILANLTLHSDGRKLLRRPAGISFTRLALAVFGERLGDLTKSVRHLIKHPPDQQYVVVLGTAHSGNWVAKIELQPPTANVEMRVSLIVLPVEDIATRGSQPARQHAVVAKGVFHQVTIVGPV